MGKTVYPARAARLVIDLHLQAHADLNQLVATGLFGFTVGDCAERMICEALRARAIEGWLAMQSPLVPKKTNRNFVGEVVAQRSKTNPQFPKMVAAAARKRRAR